MKDFAIFSHFDTLKMTKNVLQILTLAMCFTAVFKLQLKQGFVFTATDYVFSFCDKMTNYVQVPLGNISNFFQHIRNFDKKPFSITLIFFYTKKPNIFHDLDPMNQYIQNILAVLALKSPSECQFSRWFSSRRVQKKPIQSFFFLKKI